MPKLSALGAPPGRARIFAAAGLSGAAPAAAAADDSGATAAVAVASAADGAVVVSYDRLANGWKGPPGCWGECDALFTMRVRFA